MYKYYNMNQVVLPLDLKIKLKENDVAFAVNDLVESIPEEAFINFERKTGCPAYHPRMMLKLILCAYTQSVFSGRKIEALIQDSVRMMWLAQGYEPSYRTINRFRVSPDVKHLLHQCFVQFRCQLVQDKIIDEEAIFIDGTKIEANANKYTFTWKRSVEKYSEALIKKSNEKYQELLSEQIIPAIERESDEELSIDELTNIVDKLDKTVEKYTQKIEKSEDALERKILRSARKAPKQYRKQFIDFVKRKQKYAQDEEIFGNRNSYSKTDHDATFMRMKDDHMKNGQLKAGYNVQLATEGQYALAYGIYANPTDTRTFIPFLDRIEEHFFTLPEYIVADAGYGSEQNYDHVLNHRKRTPLITYNMYVKEKKRAYKKNLFNVNNWDYNKKEDIFICPNKRSLTFKNYSNRKDRYGFMRTFKVYECENCTGCPLRDQCTKAAEDRNRKVYINEKWEQQKEYIRQKLSEEKPREIYGKRKVDVEPVFGTLKANLGFSRFSVRGKHKVENELGFALMAVNLRKYTAVQGANAYIFFLFNKKTVLNIILLINRTVLSFRLSFVPASLRFVILYRFIIKCGNRFYWTHGALCS